MEGAEERHRPWPLGMPARQLQGRFQRLGPAVGEEDALRRGAGGELSKALREVDLRLVVEVGPRHVD